jgi:hypothetical protein
VGGITVEQQYSYRLCLAALALEIVYPVQNLRCGLVSTGVPPYPRVIRSKTYRGYVKPRIVPNAIYNVIFVQHT